jgi:hypothetical protein
VDGQLWHCSGCDGEREFVQPACLDGHTEDGGVCPEWACVDCGAALVTGIETGDAVRSGLAHAA